MSDKKFHDDDELIPQDHERGPGWFLKISYGVIVAFCVYYLFTYWDWKSSYDLQQEEIQKKISSAPQSSGN